MIDNRSGTKLVVASWSMLVRFQIKGAKGNMQGTPNHHLLEGMSNAEKERARRVKQSMLQLQ